MLIRKTITVELQVDVLYDRTVDASYGSDLDGNRGYRQVFIDDVRIENMPSIQAQIEKAVNDQDEL
jgi:hypothetical protein